MGWVRRFVRYHAMRHPAELSAAEVGTFLTRLAAEQSVTAATQTQALCALLFLYRTVLRRSDAEFMGLVRARKPERVPVVLSRDEVRRVLDALDGEAQLVCLLLYGAGLRLKECLQLRAKDVDFDRSQIVVRQGKGAKNRVTVLPQRGASSPAVIPLSGDITFTRPPCSGRCGMRCWRRASPSGPPDIPSDTPSPPTSWRTATTSGPFRSCWGIATWRRR